MTYTEVLEYIHGVSNFFCKPGLERIERLCLGMGNPQKELKFIHVAGTNGKGSFCAMLDSVLRAAGYKVGLYTSPYVRVFNERMRVSGENIPDSTLARITEKAKVVADSMNDRPTEFELITAIAFEYFREEKCDIVILEVGMGGRLDATNIIDAPILSVITGIDIDHTSFLGNTIEEIAGEKAGIIKENSPVIWGGTNTAAEAVIAEKADIMQTYLYKSDYSALNVHSMTLEESRFDYRGRKGLKIRLLGEYQPRNASVVLDAIDLLLKNGFSIDEKAVRDGLYMAKWPARFEIIGKEPTIIFDGAHNPQGIRAAVKSIKKYYGENKVIILTGVLSDKDYHSIAASISEVASEAFTITPKNPRALSADEYARVISSLGIKATACYGLADALGQAKEAASKSNSALCCLGSLYTYCEIISII